MGLRCEYIKPSCYSLSLQNRSLDYWFANMSFLYNKSGLEVIQLFSCSAQLSMKVQLLIKKTKTLKNIDIFAFNLSYNVFIMLIHVQMPTVNIYEQISCSVELRIKKFCLPRGQALRLCKFVHAQLNKSRHLSCSYILKCQQLLALKHILVYIYKISEFESKKSIYFSAF